MRNLILGFGVLLLMFASVAVLARTADRAGKDARPDAPSPAFASRGATALASRRRAVVLSATSRATTSVLCSMKLPPMAVPALLTRIPMRASSRSLVSTVASSAACVRSAWMMSIAT